MGLRIIFSPLFGTWDLLYCWRFWNLLLALRADKTVLWQVALLTYYATLFLVVKFQNLLNQDCNVVPGCIHNKAWVDHHNGYYTWRESQHIHMQLAIVDTAALDTGRYYEYKQSLHYCCSASASELASSAVVCTSACAVAAAPARCASRFNWFCSNLMRLVLYERQCEHFSPKMWNCTLLGLLQSLQCISTLQLA